MEMIQGIVVDVLTSVILALITLIGAYAVYYIKKATDKAKVEIEILEDKDLERVLSNALDRLSEVTTLTVNKIEQQSAKTIRAAIADGKSDKEELKKLSKKAYDEIIKVMEPEYLGLLEEILGDSKTYVLNLIEDKLVRIKERDQLLTIPTIDSIQIIN